MKKVWRRKWIVFLIIFSSIFIGIFLSTRRVAGAPDSVSKGNFTMSVDYGYDQFAKFGRYMNVTADINNYGSDFTGWLQVMVPKEKNNAAYRKEIHIEKGQRQSVVLNVPVMDDTGKLQVSLMDKYDKTLVEKEYGIRIDNYDKQTYIGILTGDREALDYFNTASTRIFYLDNSNIPDDYIGLDLLDALVIDNYDTRSLTKKQISAIEEWVDQGGTLVIGTGEYGNKTLANWTAFKVQYSGDTVRTTTSFGMNRQRMDKLKQRIISYDEERKALSNSMKEYFNANSSVKSSIDYEYNTSDWAQELIDNLSIQTISKNIAVVKLEGGYQNVLENNQVLMQTKASGHGVIQIFSFDLGLEKDQHSFGVAVAAEVTQNMSETKHNQLNEEAYGRYYNYNIYSSMSYTDTENIPKILPYIIIILLYLLSIGPLLFFILKKKDKKNITWIVVCGLSVVFTCIVYVAGSNTRIEDPFLGYIKILNFDKGSSRVKEEIYFSLTAPYNKDYSVKTGGQYDISQLSDSSSNFYSSSYTAKRGHASEEYNTAISYGLEQTRVEVSNNPAFNPLYYKAESSRNLENLIQSNLRYAGDSLKGSITNNFDFNITNSMLITDGSIMNLGGLSKGAKVTVTGKETEKMLPEGYMSSTSIINRIAGGTDNPEENDAEVNRKVNVINYLLENRIDNSYSQSYLIGFVECEQPEGQQGEQAEGQQGIQLNEKSAGQQSQQQNQQLEGQQSEQKDELLEQLRANLDSYGTCAIIIPVTIDYTSGNLEYVPSITPYLQSNNNYDKFYDAVDIMDGNATMEYILPADDTIKAFQYQPTKYTSDSTNYVYHFEGRICFLNNKTGQYDVIFRTGEKGNLTNIKDYITKQNTITLRYESNQEYQGNPVIMPEISYWKEAGKDAGN